MVARRTDCACIPGLFCKSFGEFDQDTPVGGILDLSEGNNKSQSFDNVQIDLIIPKQLQQFVAGMIEIFNVHSESSRSV